MKTKSEIKNRPGAVRGSLAYDLGNPELYPEYSYGVPLDIPAAPELSEEVVSAAGSVASAQTVSPVAFVGCAIAAVLLIFSLLARVQLTKASDQCVALEQSLAELQETNTKLLIAHESTFNMTEIEDYAVNTLGMQKPRSDQLHYITGSAEDRAVVLGETGADVSFVDKVGDFLSSIGEYFHRG
ncbi:MAG: hypothetical protein RR314_00175 [Oscillospiraceae bacterium]